MTTTSEALDAVMLEGRDQADDWRPHLGMSLIGHECDRRIWYTLNWYYASEHAPRTLRIFRTGNVTESVTTSDLKKIPGAIVETHDREGKQFELKCKELPVLAGSMDAVAYGLPEHPDEWVVVEIKSSNKSKFNELTKKGLKAHNRQHFSQLNMYMRESGLRWGIYISRCKDDDRYYTEWVAHDPYYTNQLVDRAINIVSQETPPPKIYDTPDFFMCRWCDAREVCHLNAEPPQNCRTCTNMNNNRNTNQWNCQRHNVELTTSGQREGCELWSSRLKQEQTTPKTGRPSPSLPVIR